MSRDFIGPPTWAELLEEVLVLREAVQVDLVTGLLPRPVFEKTCATIFAGARRGRRKMSFLFLDLDRFKSINDTWGHCVGDMVLGRVGEEIRNCIRVNDLAGRYGGEELMILLDDTSQEGAITFAERLRRTIEEKVIVDHGQGTVCVTTCIGVATWDGSEDLESLRRRADTAMYHAKRSGRNKVVCA
jgi:diguanylate cyclase (GGDEF)-like protein